MKAFWAVFAVIMVVGCIAAVVFFAARFGGIMMASVMTGVGYGIGGMLGILIFAVVAAIVIIGAAQAWAKLKELLQ